MNRYICDVCKEREADLFFKYKSLSRHDKRKLAGCVVSRGKIYRDIIGDGRHRNDTPEYIDICSVCYQKILDSVRSNSDE